MREKLNLSNLTKMPEKNLEEIKGGIIPPHCVCYIDIDGNTDSAYRR